SCRRADFRPSEGAYAAPMRGISTLAPGTYLHYKNGFVETHRYWSPWSLRKSAPSTDFSTVLNRAVHKRVQGCKTAALSLSGGLDSSALAASLKELGVTTELISYRFQRFPNADEGYFQKMVAEH